jgi:UDP-4-amino-4,6-dideoxy-N-acetyl-beta-L-altrosamine N-acetyltransferase
MDIIGNKIILKPITLEDTPYIVKWRNSYSVRCNFIYQDLFTTESHISWLEDMVFTGKVKQFIIIIKETGNAVGSIFLRDIDWNNDKAEYGVFIGEETARGKGLGTEAADLICQFGFQELHLNKIFLRVFADNNNAIRSYKKAGFQQEAYLKQDVKVNGQYRDVILMARFPTT